MKDLEMISEEALILFRSSRDCKWNVVNELPYAHSMQTWTRLVFSPVGAGGASAGSPMARQTKRGENSMVAQ